MPIPIKYAHQCDHKRANAHQAMLCQYGHGAWVTGGFVVVILLWLLIAICDRILPFICITRGLFWLCWLVADDDYGVYE